MTTSMLRDPERPATSRRPRSALTTLPEVRWAALSVALFALGGVAQLAGAPAALWWTLYLACYAAGGWEPGLCGLRALRERTLDVDLLMVVAAVIAAAIGQVFDGALLIVIFATSGALEAVATRRTEDSVRALLELAPEEANRVDPDGTERRVGAAALVPGDLVLIRPGERIGADGRVVDGRSDVDQATITGEPLPVARGAGDEVFAGTVNGTGTLTVRVERAAADTVIARIVALVAEASATKARTQLFIEKVEQRYSIGMVVATLLLFTAPLLSGAALEPTLLRAMTFMIVASPCAVVLATMPPLLSAIANAGRHGVLVKSAVVMEQLGTVDTVAFDKTGTLTEGRPEVVGMHVLTADLTEAQVWALVAGAERGSEHPLAAALVDAARARGVRAPDAVDFRSTPGRGIVATVAGRRVAVGSPSVQDRSDQGAAPLVGGLESGGSTAVVVRVDGPVVAVIGLADRVRDAAPTAVGALRRLTGRSPLLLTGDNVGAAGRVAAAVGITEVHAGLLPAVKVDRVRAVQAAGGRVLFVGDGVNDAPAMAAADLGVAMGRRGSDLALETADAVVVRDDLATLPAVVALSRRARRVVVANLVFAGTVIVGLVGWDLFGHLPLPLGVAGHEGSTVVVGLNGLRLLRSVAWRRAVAAGGDPHRRPVG